MDDDNVVKKMNWRMKNLCELIRNQKWLHCLARIHAGGCYAGQQRLGLAVLRVGLVRLWKIEMMLAKYAKRVIESLI